MLHRVTHYLAGAAVLTMLACAEQPSAPDSEAREVGAPVFSASGTPIDGSFVVVLEESANPRAVAAVAGVTATHVYEHALRGFAAVLNAGQLNALRHMPGVLYVEEDQEFVADATQSVSGWWPLGWGPDRAHAAVLGHVHVQHDGLERVRLCPPATAARMRETPRQSVRHARSRRPRRR